jgi:hypothetical protein
LKIIVSKTVLVLAERSSGFLMKHDSRASSYRRAYLGLRFGIKKKRAAMGRRSGNHCGRHKILNISGNAGAKAPEAGACTFAFYSPT